jgi:hypothetical protein
MSNTPSAGEEVLVDVRLFLKQEFQAILPDRNNRIRMLRSQEELGEALSCPFYQFQQKARSIRQVSLGDGI